MSQDEAIEKAPDWIDAASLMFDAVVVNDSARLSDLIDCHGQPVNVRQIFSFACLNNRFESAKLLVESFDGLVSKRVFQKCCRESGANIVRLLLEHNTDNGVLPALHRSADSGNIEVLKLLLDYCGFSDLSSLSGTKEDSPSNKAIKSAIKAACMNGHINVVDYLIGMGADIHFEEDAPIKLSFAAGHFKVYDLLFKQEPEYFTNLIQTDASLLASDEAQAYLAGYLLGQSDSNLIKKRGVKI